MKNHEREIANYHRLNRIAKKNGVVLFGSSFAKKIPVCELMQSFEMDVTICNRSIEGLSVLEAESVLNECVFELAPRKLLISLGETDLEQGSSSISEITAAYERLIAAVKAELRYCEIVLISVCNNGSELHPETLNSRLEALAAKTGCRYADISPAFSYDTPEIKAFSFLRRYIKERMQFSEAIAMLNI